jgi:hypothetical protein
LVGANIHRQGWHEPPGADERPVMQDFNSVFEYSFVKDSFVKDSVFKDSVQI